MNVLAWSGSRERVRILDIFGLLAMALAALSVVPQVLFAAWVAYHGARWLIGS